MKNRYVLLADLPLIVIAAFGAFAGRFDWTFYSERPEFPLYVLTALLIKPPIFWWLGMYRRYWQYASVQEMAVVLLAVTASSLAMALFALIGTSGVLFTLPSGFSRVVLFNDWLLTLATAGGFRLAIRVANESSPAFRHAPSPRDARRVLIVGAGAAGTLVAREMRRNPQLGMTPVGFLDDDAGKVGKHIAGLQVLAETHSLPEIVVSRRVDSVVIAMPTVRGPAVRAIVGMCQRVGVKSQTIPGVFELLDEQVSINRLRSVDIVDLLRRAQVTGQDSAASFVRDRVVLITGAGGSIGYELARQIANASPAKLVLLGHGENSVFDAEAKLRMAFPQVSIATVIADIRDERRMQTVFDRIRPEIVFHAAAHKHVPLMEDHPEEAVTNNIIGTRNVVRQALRVKTERFVLISTDKAVSPVSIMGATKRVAEAVVRMAARESGRAFVAVRFGNVLGSRGSVVHTFKSQIERGGPVTVTHPEMTRFFMTIPEAVHLVLQASGVSKGGELFVLDMGEPVKIVDLARDLIKLSGLSEDDVPIVFTGMRPGEKLHERLFDQEATTLPTSHPEVLQVVETVSERADQLDHTIDLLNEAACLGDRARIAELLGLTLPDETPADETPRRRASDLAPAKPIIVLD
jgi:FlaA1/EpsC-like NDP-sugar epimerase